MAQPLNQRTDFILRRLLRKESAPAVRRILGRARDEDLAAAMELMTPAEKRRLYNLMEDSDRRAAVLANLPEDAVRDLAEEMTQEEVVDLLERMDPDDATDVVGALPDRLREVVIAELREDSEDEVAALLSWPSESAAGLMSPLVFKVGDQATCSQAISILQAHADDLESVYYLYVTDSQERLIGVVSLRQLLLHPPSTPIVSVMDSDVISVGPYQDQEEVARYVARYDLLSIPVVSDEGVLLGIVTVDDVLDVVHEEAVEDMLRIAGVEGDFELAGRSVVGQTRMRAGWLLATAFGGVLADRVTHIYNHDLPLEVLAGLIPVVMGMGGNVGIQSTTIAVRGLATGHVQLSGALGFVFQEAKVGLLLGLLYGTLLGGYGLASGWPDPSLGISLGCSVLLAILLGSLLGAGLPVVLQRGGVDPAVATGPFVTTAVDILGIVVYFNVARAVMGL